MLVVRGYSRKLSLYCLPGHIVVPHLQAGGDKWWILANDEGSLCGVFDHSRPTALL